MKQETIISGKLWEGVTNKTKVYFPINFYTQSDVLKALDKFDLKNVSFSLSFGKTDKGFDSFIVNFE